MTVFLALLAILVPASVALAGFMIKKSADMRTSKQQQEAQAQRALEREQSEKRLAQKREQSEKRLAQEHEEQNFRLRLDAAIRAADSAGPSGNAVTSAAGLLALARLDLADLAVALLVDLWSTQVSPLSSTNMKPSDSPRIATETAIQIIDEALVSGKPDAQVMAAELLCRNAKGLDICNSLHWPSAVNSAWIPDLPVTAKLLITDALIHMALASNSKNALRELAIRLYGISDGDPSPRVKGCIGNLLCAILPAVKDLGYEDFMTGTGHGFINIERIEEAAGKASPNPDGYFEAMIEDRSRKLEKWSKECTELSTAAGMLATAACAVSDKRDGHPLDEAIS
ncbi:MAG TPA: hypothetical protein VK457_13895 [Chloroflexota bacterium]|nr:hypothetical protein [Chloroflexota bacterium]